MELYPTNELNSYHLNQLKELLNSTYWGKEFNYDEIYKMIQNSDLIFTYRDNNSDLVAFARVLTDYTFKAFILDVLVKDEFRGHGIGKKLILEIKNHSDLLKVKSFELYCKEDTMAFYQKFGFKKVPSDMNFLCLYN